MRKQVSSETVENSQIENPITIIIPRSFRVYRRTDLQVVYINDNGNVTP